MSGGSANSHTTSATFMRLRDGQKGEVKIKDAPVNIHAEDNGSAHQDQGNYSTQASFVEGEANVELERAPTNIDAGKKTGDMKHMKLVVYLSKRLDTMPDDKVEELAKELENTLGVYAAPDDLLLVELRELETGLKTLKGVQKKKFMEHVKKLKNEHLD